MARTASAMLTLVLAMASTGGIEAQSRALSRAEIQEAIDFGLSGDPQPYLLRHVRDRNGGTNDVVVAAVFTPFLRVAFAARSAHEKGRLFAPDDVPGWLVAPEILLAVRWYMGAQCEFDAAMTEPLVTAVPRGTQSIPARVVSGWRPLRVYPGASVLRRYGIHLAFTDVAVVVSYPIEFIRDDVDFLIFKHGLREGRTGGCFGRGRIPTAELESWR